MINFHALFLLIISPAYLCQDVNNLFNNINKKVLKFNALAAELAWESSINPGNPDLPHRAAKYQRERIKWEQQTCERLAALYLYKSHLMNSIQARQTYLLCRGPKFNFNDARLVSNLYEELQTIYSEAEVCIPSTANITIDKEVESAILKHLTVVNLKMKHKTDDLVSSAAKIAGEEEEKQGLCLRGEDDFEKIMELAKNEAVLRWTWLVWRDKVGPPMKKPYRRLVDVENSGARKNGYQNIGAAWRNELEIPHLRQLCRRLYDEIKPLYTLLHGVVRFYLRKQYGDVVPERGPIPAHLLGNLWSQNWEPIGDLILPKTIDLDESMKKLNWTVLHMAKSAEDFYQSFGLPAMTETFWQKSVFARGNKDTRCHGAAADMFKDGDFRLLYCSGTTKKDFYVLHHEMGHIQYFMAYATQPSLFRQANTAFHESVGDAIMYGVMTPQHLQRLGLINDSLLYITNYHEPKGIKEKIDSEENYTGFIQRENGNKEYVVDKDVNDLKDNVFESTDDILMLKQALYKIPQIPFSLLIDEYRWKYFEGGVSRGELNKIFWEMSMELQGIAPCTKRGEEYFDIGAKYHVPDNTPYIRYFLSSFLQHQLFESLCKAAVFGRRDARNSLPDTITLNRCDIYGSKAAGKLLKDFMSRGQSQHWREILQQTTGDSDISAASLKRYYRPLHGQLMKLVRKYNIPIGWDDSANQKSWYFG